MKFETAYKMATLAETDNVAVNWWNDEYETEKWECKIHQLPYFVNLFDVHSVEINDDEIRFAFFLNEVETLDWWSEIIELS